MKKKTDNRLLLFLIILIIFGVFAVIARLPQFDKQNMTQEMLIGGKTDAQWKEELTPIQYAVLRKKGTETPYTGALLNEKRKGTYVTADCGEPVFRSETKYDSDTGWPSFYQPIEGAVEEVEDRDYGMVRTEIVSKKCKSHLGHVFDDGPDPTGLRYCINSAALIFIPDEDQTEASST